jgi:hypothetical protein
MHSCIPRTPQCHVMSCLIVSYRTVPHHCMSPPVYKTRLIRRGLVLLLILTHGIGIGVHILTSNHHRPVQSSPLTAYIAITPAVIERKRKVSIYCIL